MSTQVIARSWLARVNLYHLFVMVLTLAGALVIGAAVGGGHWILVAALAAIPLVLWRPVPVALGAFSLLVLFESGALADSGGGRALGWFVGAAAAGILVAKAVVGHRLRTPPLAARWWILAVVWAGLTALWAVDPQVVIQRLPTAFALLILYLAAVCLRVEEREFRPVVSLLILGGCLAAMVSVYQYHAGIGYHAFGPIRGSLVIAGSVVNPDLFATRLMLPLALTIAAYFAAPSRFVKVSLIGICGILAMAILLTQSRAALLAVVVMAGVFMFRKGVNARILSVCGAFALLLAFLPRQFFTRVAEAGATGGAGRLSIWNVGFELAKHFGIFGAGLSNFPVAYSMYAGYAPAFRGYGAGSHNLYLQVMVECGVVGLVLLLLAVRAQLRGGRQERSGRGKPNIWLVAGEAAGWSLMVSAAFADLMWEKTFWLTWIILALATQLYGSGSRTLQQREPR